MKDLFLAEGRHAVCYLKEQWVVSKSSVGASSHMTRKPRNHASCKAPRKWYLEDDRFLIYAEHLFLVRRCVIPAGVTHACLANCCRHPDQTLHLLLSSGERHSCSGVLTNCHHFYHYYQPSISWLICIFVLLLNLQESVLENWLVPCVRPVSDAISQCSKHWVNVFSLSLRCRTFA